MYFMHGLFLTCTQKSHLYYMKSILVFTSSLSLKSPFINKESPLYLFGGPASCLRWRIPSTLVPTAHHFAFTPFSPHSSHYTIYIDDINNHGLLRPVQYYTVQHTVCTHGVKNLFLCDKLVSAIESLVHSFCDQLFYTFRLTSDIFAVLEGTVQKKKI